VAHPRSSQRSGGVRSQRERWAAGQRWRERRKILGLLLVAFLILIIAFARLAKPIPWGAR